MLYTLSHNGDDYERLHYPLIQKQFPSYEVFWQKYVVPLTQRPHGIQFKTDPELTVLSKGPNDLCLAQLHYTVFRQLVRAAIWKKERNLSDDHLLYPLTALVGAQDCAFELLQRFISPGQYDPWLEKKQRGSNIEGGDEAQKKWKRTNNYPLQPIRDYRNRLVHGRICPGIKSGTQNMVPKINRTSSYVDWRTVTANPNLPIADFAPPIEILNLAFNETINYFDSQWKQVLLKYPFP